MERARTTRNVFTIPHIMVLLDFFLAHLAFCLRYGNFITSLFPCYPHSMLIYVFSHGLRINVTYIHWAFVFGEKETFRSNLGRATNT